MFENINILKEIVIFQEILSIMWQKRPPLIEF